VRLKHLEPHSLVQSEEGESKRIPARANRNDEKETGHNIVFHFNPEDGGILFPEAPLSAYKTTWC
jgi:hypothetical protein